MLFIYQITTSGLPTAMKYAHLNSTLLQQLILQPKDKWDFHKCVHVEKVIHQTCELPLTHKYIKTKTIVGGEEHAPHSHVVNSHVIT